MANQLDDVLALIAAMKPEDRDRLVRMLTASGSYEVRDVDAPSYQQRKLVRHHGRLVVEALPNEERIDTAEVRDLLNKMEW